MDVVARSPADGYTLMFGTSEMAFLPFLKKSYRYDPLKDFTPVALVTTSWTVFAVNPKVPAQTLPELVSYAKANPGSDPLRQRRRRRRAAHRGRDAEAEDRRRLRAHSLPRRLAGRDRCDLRPDRDGFDGTGQHAHRRQAASCASWRRPARAAIRCCPTCPPPPSRPARRAHGHLVRRDRAAQPAAEPVTGPPGAGDQTRWCTSKSFQEKLSRMGCAVAWKPPAEFASLHCRTKRRKWSQIIPAHGHHDRGVRTGSISGDDEFGDMAERQEDCGVDDVMFETWSEGNAPTYSVQTTHLKPGTVDHASKAWSTYGGRVGVWRIHQHARPPGNSRRRSSPTPAAPRNIPTPCKRDRQVGPRPRRPCLHAGPAARLPAARSAGGDDPQEHRPARSRAAARR